MSEPNSTTGAGQAILEFAERLRSLDSAKPEIQRTFETWVVFRIANRNMGLPVSHVREILKVPEFTRVPNAPQPVAGIMNLRGQALPLVDGHSLFSLPPSFDTDLSRVLVFLFEGRAIGIVVDEALGLKRLEVELTQEAPDSDPLGHLARGLHRVTEDESTLLLEPKSLFSDRRVDFN